MDSLSIREIFNTFECNVNGCGMCTALFIISPRNIETDPQYIVRIHETGYLRRVDQNDIIVYGNPSGQKLVPDTVKEHGVSNTSNLRDSATCSKETQEVSDKKKVTSCGSSETIVRKPQIVVDKDNKTIKIIGKVNLCQLADEITDLYILDLYDSDWIISGQNETFININNDKTLREFLQDVAKNILPTETICE